MRSRSAGTSSMPLSVPLDMSSSRHVTFVALETPAACSASRSTLVAGSTPTTLVSLPAPTPADRPVVVHDGHRPTRSRWSQCVWSRIAVPPGTRATSVSGSSRRSGSSDRDVERRRRAERTETLEGGVARRTAALGSPAISVHVERGLGRRRCGRRRSSSAVPVSAIVAGRRGPWRASGCVTSTVVGGAVVGGAVRRRRCGLRNGVGRRADCGEVVVAVAQTDPQHAGDAQHRRRDRRPAIAVRCPPGSKAGTRTDLPRGRRCRPTGRARRRRRSARTSRNLLAEQIPRAAGRPVQPHPDDARWDAGHPGELVRLPPADVAEHDQLPIALRHRPEPAEQLGNAIGLQLDRRLWKPRSFDDRRLSSPRAIAYAARHTHAWTSRISSPRRSACRERLCRRVVGDRSRRRERVQRSPQTRVVRLVDARHPVGPDVLPHRQSLHHPHRSATANFVSTVRATSVDQYR